MCKLYEDFAGALRTWNIGKEIVTLILMWRERRVAEKEENGNFVITKYQIIIISLNQIQNFDLEG